MTAPIVLSFVPGIGAGITATTLESVALLARGAPITETTVVYLRRPIPSGGNARACGAAQLRERARR